MALLGAQLVITLVTVSVMQKVGSHCSAARWLLCRTGLVRYLYPTNTELRELANIPKEKGKGRKGGGRHGDNGKTQEDTFHVPRNLDITLERTPVSPLDVVHLRFYVEYQWLLDFALYAALVYLLTELYQNWFPLHDELNLSMVWLTLVLVFVWRLLAQLTVQYFRGEESIGERSMCIVMGFTYLLIAMVLLIVDERVLELQLEPAYESFNASASEYLQASESVLSSPAGPASKLVIKFFVAVWCAMVGAMFTFPGLRVARAHWDLQRGRGPVLKLLLNMQMALPFLLVLLWVRPVSRDYATARVFSGMSAPLMSVPVFESVRLALVVVVVLMRLVLMPVYLQAYLDMAVTRLEEQRREAGRILNTDLQKRVAAVFYYVCVVALQYVLPVVQLACLAAMLKTLGGYSWLGEHGEEPECPLQSKDNTELPLALHSLRAVFSATVWRGLLTFATWWTCFAWFATTAVGLVYQSTFTHT